MEIKLGGAWLPLKRTVNNQWPYYNTNGPWQTSFPMPIRVTSVTGETIEDAITGVKGGQGTSQFSDVSGGGGGASSVRHLEVPRCPVSDCTTVTARMHWTVRQQLCMCLP